MPAESKQSERKRKCGFWFVVEASEIRSVKFCEDAKF